jgi:hypothetical protein
MVSFTMLHTFRDRNEQDPSTNASKTLDDQKSVLAMFNEVQSRLTKLRSENPRQLAAYNGANAARYAGALVALHACVRKYFTTVQGELGRILQTPNIVNICTGFGDIVRYSILAY